MKATTIATTPPPAVPPTMSVKDAMPQMENQTGCAVGIVADGKLVGLLSKNDVLQRIVAAGLDPSTTTVGEVMSPPPVTASADIDTGEALRVMFEHKTCCLPLLNESGHLVSWLAICHLFEGHLDLLKDQIDTLANFAGADGPGG